jgi:hypothetical protein
MKIYMKNILASNHPPWPKTRKITLQQPEKYYHSATPHHSHNKSKETASSVTDEMFHCSKPADLITPKTAIRSI